MSRNLNPDFQFVRGDNHGQQFRAIVAGTEDPFDLTDAELRFSVKANKKDLLVLFQRRNAEAGGGPDQIEVTNAAAGEFTVYIVPDNTADLEGDLYYWYDIEARFVAEVITIKKPARFLLIQDITPP